MARGALDRVIRTLKEAEETTTALAHVGYAALGAAASTIIGYVGWNPPPDGAECKHLLFLGLAGTFLGVGTCCLCLQRIRDNHQRSNFRHLREELAEIATGSQVLEDKQTPVPRYGSGPGLR